MIKNFKSAVGISRQWNARIAGREVATNTLKMLNGKKPNFFLLFSTIHYDKEGGFKEFLNGVWEILPQEVPLIGGTVAGFISSDGCYTRGAVALAVSYPKMDATVGLGKNTKGNPKKAAQQCITMLKKGLKNSKYNKGFIIDLISGGLIFEIPLLGRRRVFRWASARLVNILIQITSLLFGRGPGREEEVLEEFVKNFGDLHILSGSCMDNNLFLKNYQFYNKKVFENSVVALAVKTDLDFDIEREHGLAKTNKKIKITKISTDRRFIHEINGKPAVPELLKIMSWPDDFISEKQLHNTTLYYPLGFNRKDKTDIDIIALITGNSLCMTHQIKGNELYLHSASGKMLIDAVNNCLQPFLKFNSPLGFIFSCGIRLDTLGSKSYLEKQMLTKYFKDNPFLLVYVTGEGVYTPSKGFYYGNDTFNLFAFLNK